MASAYLRRALSTESPRRRRGVASTHLHGISTSPPRRRLDSSSPHIHVTAAASPRLISTAYPRHSRGVAATSLHGMFTSQPRWRRDPSLEDLRRESTGWRSPGRRPRPAAPSPRSRSAAARSSSSSSSFRGPPPPRRPARSRGIRTCEVDALFRGGLFRGRRVAAAPRPRRGYSVEAATAEIGFLKRRRCSARPRVPAGRHVERDADLVLGHPEGPREIFLVQLPLPAVFAADAPRRPDERPLPEPDDDFIRSRFEAGFDRVVPEAHTGLDTAAASRTNVHVAATRLHGIFTSRPRRRLHGIFTSRPRRRLHGISTSRPRRRRESSKEAPRSEYV